MNPPKCETQRNPNHCKSRLYPIPLASHRLLQRILPAPPVSPPVACDSLLLFFFSVCPLHRRHFCQLALCRSSPCALAEKPALTPFSSCSVTRRTQPVTTAGNRNASVWDTTPYFDSRPVRPLGPARSQCRATCHSPQNPLPLHLSSRGLQLDSLRSSVWLTRTAASRRCYQTSMPQAPILLPHPLHQATTILCLHPPRHQPCP